MGMQKSSGLEEIAKYVFTSKYARYIESEGRREAWDETVNRTLDMHLNKFGDSLPTEDLSEIEWAFDMVRQKKVVPSMRAMQFGGRAIEANNLRGYNCSVMHVDKVRAFSEAFFLLLSGCGVGFGLSKEMVSKLPHLVSAEDRTGIVQTYVIEDSIEGWSDSIEALLNCYFKNTAYTGRKIVFDYSRIRPAGSPLKTSGGKAPGHEGLKAAHIKIKDLLDRIIEVDGVTAMRPIHVYDILMHVADAVLSGGVRRSACITIFDRDDEEMMNAKVGNWFEENPQRGRSNNSVRLIRGEFTLEDLAETIEMTREWGEPGFVFTNDDTTLTNPCQPGWAPILTRDGIRSMSDISVGDEIWSETGWVKVSKKWSTGVKDVYAYRTTAGAFYGTENHRLISNGERVEARDADSIDILAGPTVSTQNLNPHDIMAGLVVGDGSRAGGGSTQAVLAIGARDTDYFESEIGDLIEDPTGWDSYTYRVKTEVSTRDLAPLPERVIPEKWFYGDATTVAGFLRGLFSANGSVIGGKRVALKTTSSAIRDGVQFMLSSLGIRSYYTTNKPSLVKWHNGEYESRESYDINVVTDLPRFMGTIGFIQRYKNESVVPPSRSGRPKETFDVTSVEYVSTEEVFDITVDSPEHTYWTGGHNVSNCAEISFNPTINGVNAVQVCNLTEINGAKVESLEDFLEASRAASIIGTLQATYTDFPYLSHAAEELTRRDALLGVSITAMMDNPEILFDAEAQSLAAITAVMTNEKWAGKLGINPAARVTCVKPAGTSTIVLESMSSGIHPSHSHRMFRRVQANKLDPIYQYFSQWNPHATEQSVWSTNGTDDVITFPIELPESTVVKSDLSAIEHLEMIRSTQENWVSAGRDADRGSAEHNVSCTVLVGDDEWDEVIDYLFTHQRAFAAVSLLPRSGDKDYAQAPMEAVTTPEDVERFERLVDLWTPVDYSFLNEDEDNTTLNQEAACVGGACEII